MDNSLIFKKGVNPCGKSREFPKVQIGNDPLWRAGDSEALRNMASFPFSNSVGGDAGSYVRLPGIMTFHTLPNFGHSQTASSPIQKAASSLFNYITQNFTGTQPTFEASDLFCYQGVNSAGLAILITEFKRMVGVMRKYSYKNEYIARYLVTALGFDFDDFSGHMVDAISKLNLIIDEINDKFYFLNEDPILSIRSNMYGRVFTDGLGAKVQYYAFVPEGYAYFAYDTGIENTTPFGVSALKFKERPGLYTRQSFFEMLEYLMNSISNNQDINIMSGALLRSYGEGKRLKYEYAKIDYEISFDFDHVMLSEIHNIKFAGKLRKHAFFASDTNTIAGVCTNSYASVDSESSEPLNMDDLLVYQNDKGHLISTPCILINKQFESSGDEGRELKAKIVREYITGQKFLDIPSEDPNPGDVIDATAYMFAYNALGREYQNEDVNYDEMLINCSTDLPLYGKLFTMSSNLEADSIELTSLEIDPYNYVSLLQLYPADGSTAPKTAFLRKYVKFDYAPLLYTSDSFDLSDWNERRNNDRPRVDVIGDVYNYTLISNPALAELFSKSWFKMYKIPRAVKSVSK